MTPFSRCPFWTAVGDRAFGGWSSVTRRMAELQPRVVRQRRVPQLVTGLAGAAYRRELDEYVDVHHRLYRAIAAVSGAEVVVDASKSTAQLFALRHIDGLDLRVVNLVRDSRGVAHSWTKAGIRKPQSADGAVMGTYPPHRLAVLWATLQLESAFLRAAAPHGARVRYEDLVAQPRPALRRALSDVGLPPAAGGLDHVGERSVTLGPSHGVAGSRTRFTDGRIELRSTMRGARRWPQGRPPGGHRRDPPPAGGLRVRRVATAPRQGRLDDPRRPTSGPSAVPTSSSRRARRFLKPGWPLVMLYARLPAVVGARARPAHLLRMAAAAMAVILYRQRTLRRAARLRASGCCSSSGCWRVSSWSGPIAPGTVPGGGIGRLGGFLVWAGWYLAITVAMLYVVNTARQVPTQRIVRLLGWMFVVTTGVRGARRRWSPPWSSSRRWSWSCPRA